MVRNQTLGPHNKQDDPAVDQNGKIYEEGFHFGNDSLYVRTTEAAFRLSLPPVEKPESPAESQTWHKDSFSFEEKSSPWKGWETKDDWLTWNRRKIVWLPPDYRKGTIAISGRITVANELGFPVGNDDSLVPDH